MTEAVDISAPSARATMGKHRTAHWVARQAPVVIVTLGILALWYAFAASMNAAWVQDQAERAGETLTRTEIISRTMDQDRPVLPAPHQVAVELWETTAEKNVTSKRSLIYHGWITLSATLLGFAMGVALGVGLAVLIVHNRAMDLSLMPWVVASQTIPILAIAPMIIVVLNAVGLSGLVPKALISTYLAFFPVTVAMVKGLRSPDPLQLDLLRTYNATTSEVLWKLRWPAATPYLFPALKVAAALALVGAIVGELPTGAVAGLGARLLAGSYYGQTIQIWSALAAAAILAAGLVWLISVLDRYVRRRMGFLPDSAVGAGAGR